MAKKDKKKKEKGEKLSRKERKEEKKRQKDSWIYYPDNSVGFIVAVLVIFCVLDVIIAVYAIAYSKRVERESIARAELASSPVERSVQGSAWFLQKDGTVVYERTSREPDIPQAGAPAVPETDEPAVPVPGEGEGQSAEGEAQEVSAETPQTP